MGISLFDIETIRDSHIDALHTLGKPVYDSDVFREARTQKHHKHTTVALHSERVAAMCLHLADRLGMTIDEELVVLGALSHDLGIIGRYEKFNGEMETYLRHPGDSADIAKDLLGEKYNDVMDDMIRNHMWPLSDHTPDTKEGLLIVMADKLCAIRESGHSIAKVKKHLYAWISG